MNDLGRIEDLPSDYVAKLRELNLVPLWPSLRSVLPAGKPRPKTKPTHWPYATLKPLLLQAGDLTPIEKAERRVLVLANPGHGLDNMQASSAMYLGMQLLLPGEWAPSHRHTPNAVRMIVEGTGAYTTVNGEKLPMERGDLILTPTGLWHEHGHDGDQPVVWLDVLDLPLMHYLETSYHINGDRQAVRPTRGDATHAHGGLAPTPWFEPTHRQYPMLRYPWAQAKSALHALGEQQAEEDCIQITYINPATGGHAENVLGFYALMLRPAQVLTLPARSPALVMHCIEGRANVDTAESSFHLTTADTACMPGYEPIQVSNASINQPAYLFLADETPLHQKLGIYETR